MWQQKTPIRDWLGLREALGLTQREMADLICVSRRTVQVLETDPRARPHRATMVILRARLADRRLAARLRSAAYPHPWPQDVLECN